MTKWLSDTDKFVLLFCGSVFLHVIVTIFKNLKYDTIKRIDYY